MNYELAIELKDAGFFQSGEGDALSVRNEDLEDDDAPMNVVPWNKYVYEPNNWPNVVYAPTLAELIEACGSEFRRLTLHSENEKHTGLIWQATPNQHYARYKQGVRGSTPEEAVARLWLALNRKA